MNQNPLLVVESFGQSIWLDWLLGNALKNGEIQGLINSDKVTFLAPEPIASLGL